MKGAQRFIRAFSSDILAVAAHQFTFSVGPNKREPTQFCSTHLSSIYLSIFTQRSSPTTPPPHHPLKVSVVQAYLRTDTKIGNGPSTPGNSRSFSLLRPVLAISGFFYAWHQSAYYKPNDSYFLSAQYQHSAHQHQRLILALPPSHLPTYSRRTETTHRVSN